MADVSLCQVCKVRRSGATEGEISTKWKEVRDGGETGGICSLCLGILDPKCCQDVFDAVVKSFKQEGYSSPDFCLNVSMPVSTIIREFRQDLSFDTNKKPDCSSVRDSFKYIASEEIEKQLGVPHSNRSLLAIQINYGHQQESTDCHFLSQVFPDKFEAKRWTGGGKWAKINTSTTSTADQSPPSETGVEGIANEWLKAKRQRRKEPKVVVYTRVAVERVLKDILESPQLIQTALDIPEFRDLLSIPPTDLVSFNVEFVCEPLYLGGRYNKFSRYVSQSVWMVDGVRVGAASIEEIVGGILKEEVKADSYTFMSAGREDIDVRCLGDGRPFAVQLTNARNKLITQQNLIDWTMKINSATADVQVSLLQPIDEKKLKDLKEGEATKTKTYAALCYSQVPLSQAQLDTLVNATVNLQIQQKTPIRVLHRRPLATRLRTIFVLRATLMDDRHFLLRCKTEAGTYVKEFVHGDMDRTTPSLRDILGVPELDIIELDVESVDLKWP